MKKGTKDAIFRALSWMGSASNSMSWANNNLEDLGEVSEEIKSEMKQINVEIHRMQEKIRAIKGYREGETL
jgi:hypothetical protein